MQSWHAVPDGTDPDSGHGSWPSGYGFPDQAGQYENSSQTWSQPLAGQPMYTSIGPNQASNTAAFYPNNTPQGGAILGDGMNGVSSVPQGSFTGQGGLAQYRPDQDPYNMEFESLQQDGFSQQGKLDLGQGLGELTRAQPHQGQTGFVPNSYASYPSSDDQAFGSGLAMPAPSKMLSGNAAALDRVPQQPPSQQQQQKQQQQQQQPQPQPQPQQQQQQQQQRLQHPFQPTQVYSQPPQQHLSHPQSLEQIPQPYSPSVTPQGRVYQAHPGHGHPLNQQQAQLQSHAYLAQHPGGQFSVSQSPGATQDGVKQFASAPAPAAQQNVIQSASAVSTPPTPVQALAAQGMTKRDAERVGTPQSAQDSSEQSTSTEPAPKKRKRVLKKTPEPQGAGMLEPHHQSDMLARNTVDTDRLPLPGSNDHDLAILDAFKKKRTVGATSRFPALPGAPHLATSGTTKLPTPKSYDKLAPLVAMPSQSGKPVTPEVGRSLPCEIQGTFSAKFKPSPDGAGLEDRRREAKNDLAEYDKAMEALGNHRPKYTEYPHAFKEQLKTDEALKTKAERLARKLAEEERNKPVRSDTRPSDPVEGAAWDIIGYVHIPPAATRTTSLLAGAVQQAGEYIMARRGEMTRAKLEVDQAIKSKDETDLPALTAAAELKKEVLYRTLEAANKVGDEVVLENLGGHGKLVLSLVNLLITCIKTGDFSGKLPKAALSLMANFKMTKKVATQTNFDNIRRRLTDKGDAEVKELLDTVTSRIRKEPDADASPKKPAVTSSTSEAKTKPVVSKPSTESLSTKRARVDDTDSRVAKKQAIESSGSAQPVVSKANAPAGTQPKMAPAKPRPTGGILPGKSRPASKPVSKPVATTKAESAKTEPAKAAGEDKPGAKADVKKPAKSEPKPETTRLSKPSSSGGGGLGGIASLLDSINAPKAKPKPAPDEPKDEPIKDETPEEKEKRLRKLSRRRLRVSWKGDDELEEVRYFHKGAEEDEGFDSRMTRDAGDDKREGMALKQRGMMMDEDEDEDEDDGIPYRPWLEPTPLDLSPIPAEYRRKTYQTRGGDIVVETDEQKAIAQREQTVLMAIYTDIADIPPTPKSPSIRAVETSADVKIGHLPRDDPRFEEVHRRWKEVQQLGRDAALQYATRRIESKKQSSSKVNSALPTTATAGPDPRNSLSTMSREDQVLVLLANDRARKWRSAEPSAATKRRYDYPDPRVQYAADLVEDLVPKLNGPYPATEPPAWIKDNPEAVREWWHGYDKDATTKAKKDADDKARVEAEQTAATQNQAGQDAWASYYAQQQAYAPYMAILQQLQGGQAPASSAPVAQPSQAGNNDQLQAVLAAMGHGQTQGGPAAATPANATPQLNPNDPTYQQLMMLSQLAQQPHGEHGGAPAYGSGGSREWDRERDREFRPRDRERDVDWDGDYDPSRSDKGDREDRRGGHKKHKGSLPPHRPVNRALIGTKPCVFFKQGTCARGDQCTFRHE